MSNGVLVSILFLVSIAQIFVLQTGNAAVTCGQVDAALLPCMAYLSGGAAPSPACCAGVKIVKEMAQTTADKRTCCNCVKAAAIRFTDLKDEQAKSLPYKCGVELDIPISRSVNCDQIFKEEEEEEGHIFMAV